MKTKTLLILMGITIILLIYNLFCYKLANSIIQDKTKEQIKNYLNNLYNQDIDYDYLNTYSNKDNSISVYIRAKDQYYRFIMVNDNGYKILDVNQDIPVYIRKVN